MPTTSQLVKHLLIQRLITVTRPHRQKYVATNIFMNNFAVSSEALKYNLLITFK